jgi:hypothetical protein
LAANSPAWRVGDGDRLVAGLGVADVEDGPEVGFHLGLVVSGHLGEDVARSVHETPLAQARGERAGGVAILRVGLGDTFVPEDLAFMGLTAPELRELNPRLVPLLAHDRAGFGGGVVTLGLTTGLCLWCAKPSRHLHQAVGLAGAASITAALGVHFVVGYTDMWHLLPAVAAATFLVVGLAIHHPGLPPHSSPGPADQGREPVLGERRQG